MHNIILDARCVFIKKHNIHARKFYRTNMSQICVSTLTLVKPLIRSEGSVLWISKEYLHWHHNSPPNKPTGTTPNHLAGEALITTHLSTQPNRFIGNPLYAHPCGSAYQCRHAQKTPPCRIPTHGHHMQTTQPFTLSHLLSHVFLSSPSPPNLRRYHFSTPTVCRRLLSNHVQDSSATAAALAVD